MDVVYFCLTSLYVSSIMFSLILSFLLADKIFKSKRAQFISMSSILLWGILISISSILMNILPITYVSAFLGGVFLYKFLFKFTLAQSCLWSSFIIFHMIVFKVIIVGLMSLLLKENSYILLQNSNSAMVSAILSQTLHIVTMALYIKTVNIKNSRTFLLNKKQLVNTLICHATITAFMFINSIFFYYNLDLMWISISQSLIAAILYFVYIVILHYGINTSVLIQHTLRSQAQLEIIQTQMRQQNSLAKMSEIVNTFKHEYREHMLMIEDYIENQRYECALMEIKKDCLHHLAQLPCTKKFSNNVILNSLLIDRQSVCDSLGIHLEALVYFPQDLSITEKEFHEVMRILTNNAIEANEKVLKEKRYLHIKTKIEHQWLSVLIENPYDGDLVFEDNFPIASIDNEGMGLIYVRELLEEKFGIILLDANKTSKSFKVTLLIRLDRKRV